MAKRLASMITFGVERKLHNKWFHRGIAALTVTEWNNGKWHLTVWIGSGKDDSIRMVLPAAGLFFMLNEWHKRRRLDLNKKLINRFEMRGMMKVPLLKRKKR